MSDHIPERPPGIHESALREVAGGMLVGIILNQDGYVKYMNEAATTITGFSRDEVMQWKQYEFFDHIHPDDKAKVIEQFYKKQASAPDQARETIYRILTKGGQPRWIKNFSQTVHYEGKPGILLMLIDVTESKELERKVCESEDKFRTVAEESPVGICILQDNKIAYVNRMVSDVLMFGKDEIMGWTLDEMMGVVPDAFREFVKSRLYGVLSGVQGSTEPYALEVFSKDGSVRILQITPRKIVINEQPAVLVLVENITTRKLAEQALRESEEKFRMIAERSMIGIMINDDVHVQYVNERACSLYGYTPEEMLKWTPAHMVYKVHPEDRPRVQERFDLARSIQENPRGPVTYRVISRDGNVRWLETFSSNIHYKGRPAELVMLADLTSEKYAEERLRASEEKYRQVFETSASGIFLLSPKGAILDCNTTVERVFKVERSYLIGKKLQDFQQFFTSDAEIIIDMLNLVNKGEAVTARDLEVKRDKAMTIWVNVQVSRVDLGGVQVNQLIINDVTSKKDLERMRDEENKKLKELDDMRNNFISTATHELKTPLATLYGATEFVLRSLHDELSEHARSLLELAHRNAVRLRDMINSMLDVSMLERGKFTTSLEELALDDLVWSSINTLEYLIKASSHEVIVNIADDSCRLKVMGDKTRLEQVMINLLSNAIKNTPSGGKIVINLSVDGSPGEVVVSIRDSGIGLTREEMGRLFTQFGKFDRHDLRTAVDIQGTGLGLFISKNIIELHNGRIWAESEGRNKGSTFYFSLARI